MSELISHFGIDWKLLLAQVVNFAILFLLLRYFAYKPIVQMLRKRRDEIAKGLTASKRAQTELARVEELKESARRQAQGEALAIVTNAEALGKKRKEEITQEALKKGEGMLAETKRAIQEERAKLGEIVTRDAHGLIRLGLERVLGKMTPKERDEVLIKEAMRELKTTSR